MNNIKSSRFCLIKPFWVTQRQSQVYDTIRFDILVRNTAAFMLHAYAVNPTGEIRSSSSYIRVSDLEPSKNLND